jgi:hypothetical protein
MQRPLHARRGIRLCALPTNKAGMSFSFMSIMLSHTRSIKDSDFGRAAADRAAVRTAVRAHDHAFPIAARAGCVGRRSRGSFDSWQSALPGKPESVRKQEDNRNAIDRGFAHTNFSQGGAANQKYWDQRSALSLQPSAPAADCPRRTAAHVAQLIKAV